jgi:HSP20 family protein
MNIIRQDPWNWMNRLHRDLDHLVASRVAGDNDTDTISDWVPAVDVAESNDGFVIRADLPGVDAKDVAVTMENGLLSIQGTRQTTSESETEGYKRTERASGRFFRRFALPDTSDSQGIAAQARDGVLEIRIPKKPQVQPQRIEVKS